VAVANLTTAYAALSLGFARREGGKVVVEEEAVVTLTERVIDHLLVEFRAERTGDKGLSFTACEDG
jgi:hypothetical protein